MLLQSVPQVNKVHTGPPSFTVLWSGYDAHMSIADTLVVKRNQYGHSEWSCSYTASYMAKWVALCVDCIIGSINFFNNLGYRDLLCPDDLGFAPHMHQWGLGTLNSILLVHWLFFLGPYSVSFNHCTFLFGDAMTQLSSQCNWPWGQWPCLKSLRSLLLPFFPTLKFKNRLFISSPVYGP